MSDELPHDEELRSLYRRLPADEPRAEIDDAILSAARGLADAAAREIADVAPREAAEPSARAAADREHERHRLRFLLRVRYAVPLAAVAGVLLTVTIARQLPDRPDPRVAAMEMQNRLEENARETMSTGQAKLRRDAEVDAKAKGSADAEQPANPDMARSSRPLESLGSHAGGDTGSGSGAALESAPPPPPADTRLATKDDAPAAPMARAPAAKAAVPAAPSPAAVPDRDSRRQRYEGIAAGRATSTDTLAKKESSPETQAEPGAQAIGPAAKPNESARLAERKRLPQANVVEERKLAEDRKLEDKKKHAENEKPGDESLLDRNELAAAGASALAYSAPEQPWPFGLEPGLPPTEACRRMTAAVNAKCEFDAGSAVIVFGSPVVVDRGEFEGNKVFRVTLFAGRGALSKVSLELEGFTTEQALVAPSASFPGPGDEAPSRAGTPTPAAPPPIPPAR